MEKSAENVPFDAVAEEYDNEFSRHPLGRAKRALVQEYLRALLKPESHLLELNGGTGEDACYLAPLVASVITTDASPEMIRVAREKFERLPEGVPRPMSGVMRIEEVERISPDSRRDQVDRDPHVGTGHDPSLHEGGGPGGQSSPGRCDRPSLHEGGGSSHGGGQLSRGGSPSSTALDLVGTNAPYDLILSNFDGFNCVRDHAPIARGLLNLLRPGGDLVVVFMARHPLIEKVRDLVRGRFGRMIAGRGVIDGTAVSIGNGSAIETWFPPVADVTRTFREAGFLQVDRRAIGLLLPPTTMRDFYRRNEKIFHRLGPIDRILSPLPVLDRMGDHVLLRLRRPEMCEGA